MRNDKNIAPSFFKKHWLLYSISATILIISIFGLIVAILPTLKLKIDQNIIFVISAIYLLAASSLFLWIYLRNQDQKLVGDLPQAIEQISTAIKLYKRIYHDTESIITSAHKLQNLIEPKIGELLDTNKSIEKELMQLRQDKGNNQRELEEWYSGAIEFFKLLERALENTQNDSDYPKILREFEKIVQKRGLSRIAPSPNDPFDEGLHLIQSSQSLPDVKPELILKCERWGYQYGTKILKKADVTVSE